MATAAEIVDEINLTGPTEEQYKLIHRNFARFPRTYYGEPYIVSLQGFWFFVVEEDAGYGTWRPISETFAKAWLAEFAGEGE